MQAVSKAAFLPAVFTDIHDEYGDRIPGEHSLEVYLAKLNFNPNTVPGVMRVYRDTMEFVKDETSVYEEEVDESDQPEMPMQTQLARQPAQDTAVPVPSRIATSPLDSSWTDQLQLRLGEGVTALVAFRGEATPEAVAKLIKLLALQYDLDIPKVTATPQRELSPVALWAATAMEDAQE